MKFDDFETIRKLRNELICVYERNQQVAKRYVDSIQRDFDSRLQKLGYHGTLSDDVSWLTPNEIVEYLLKIEAGAKVKA